MQGPEGQRTIPITPAVSTRLTEMRTVRSDELSALPPELIGNKIKAIFGDDLSEVTDSLVATRKKFERLKRISSVATINTSHVRGLGTALGVATPKDGEVELTGFSFPISDESKGQSESEQFLVVLHDKATRKVMVVESTKKPETPSILSPGGIVKLTGKNSSEGFENLREKYNLKVTLTSDNDEHLDQLDLVVQKIEDVIRERSIDYQVEAYGKRIEARETQAGLASAKGVMGPDLEEVSGRFQNVEEQHQRLKKFSRVDAIVRSFKLGLGRGLVNYKTGTQEMVGFSYPLPGDQFLVALNDKGKRKILVVEPKKDNPKGKAFVKFMSPGKKVYRIAGNNPVDSFAEEYGKLGMEVALTSDNLAHIDQIDALVQRTTTVIEAAQREKWIDTQVER